MDKPSNCLTAVSAAAMLATPLSSSAVTKVVTGVMTVDALTPALNEIFRSSVLASLVSMLVPPTAIRTPDPVKALLKTN